MWIAYVALVLVVAAAVAAILGGGIFTLILLPLGVVAAVTALWAAALARFAEGARQPSSDPESLVEARRREQ